MVCVAPPVGDLCVNFLQCTLLELLMCPSLCGTAGARG